MPVFRACGLSSDGRDVPGRFMQQSFDCGPKYSDRHCRHQPSTSKTGTALRAGSALARAELFLLPKKTIHTNPVKRGLCHSAVDDKWSSAPNLRLVLFEESGGTHFKKSYGINEVDALTQEWQEGVALAFDATNVAKRPDLEIFILGEFRQDESYGIPETTWQRKDHHRIGINALVNMNLRDLESLREFR